MVISRPLGMFWNSSSILCYKKAQLLFSSWSSLELHHERSGVADTQSALAGKGIRNPVPEAAPGEGPRPSAAQPDAATGCLRSAGVSMWGRAAAWPPCSCCPGQGAVFFPPSCSSPLFRFSHLFFPLCPARVSFADSAAPWHMQSFAHLSGQALSTCRGIEGKVDTIHNSSRASFRDASGVYRSWQPVSQPQGSWVLESGSEGLGILLFLLLNYGGSWGFN